MAEIVHNSVREITIRKAELNDIEWISKQLKDFSEFYETKNNLFGSDENAAEFMTNLITNHVVYVAMLGSLGIGLVAGWAVMHPFNKEISTLSETFWWVDPAHRGSRAGLMLLNKFVEEGKNYNWTLFTLEDKSPVNEKTLTKRGFKLKERTFILENN